MDRDNPAIPQLRRVLTFWPLLFYGLGVIVGAGIYVALGEVIGRAGPTAPMSFLIAGVCAGLTGLSYAELSGRFPEAAGAAAYARRAFGDKAAIAVGLFTTIAAAVSAASIARGAVTYLDDIIPLPAALQVGVLVVAFGALAAWGVRQSVWLAAAIGALEMLGLFAAFSMGLTKAGDVPPLSMLPGDAAGWHGAAAGAFIAFFAYTGFETLANMSEEVKDAKRTVPRAILAAVAISLLIYVAVSVSAVLGGSTSENSLVSLFPGRWAFLFTLVASLCVANGALVQITMLARLFYGMSRNGELPNFLSQVSERTGTPLAATAVATSIILVTSVGLTFQSLLVIANLLTLAIFILVNVALLRVKALQGPASAIFCAPAWVPSSAAGLSALMMLAHFLA
jgi:APA family basic amino acid/polyamine antiporter